MNPRATLTRARSHPGALGAPAVALLLICSLAMLLAACGTAQTAPLSRVTSTTAQSGHTTLTYVALGASDAFGIGTDYPVYQSWPSVLTRRLGGSSVHLVNLGIPGATVENALQQELPIALDAHPDIVTIWLAVNDLADGVSLASYQTELSQLVTSVRAQTHARVFVANLPDLTLLPYFSHDDPVALAAHVHQWNAAIATICASSGATLVDLYAQWSALADHPEYLSGDGLHPSSLGAQALAAVFATAIQHTSPDTASAPPATTSAP